MEHQSKNIMHSEVDNPTEPLVSVIVITYNSSKYVLETLESIKRQTYHKIELIISDDCSMDNSVIICSKWIELNKLRFVRTILLTNETNTGISPNLNRGLFEAKGDWVKPIAGDDILTEESIRKCIEFIKSRRYDNIQLIHGRAKMYHENFEEINFIGIWGKPEWKFNRNDIKAQEQNEILLRACHVLAPTIFIKRSVYEIVGYYDEEYPLWEDRPMYIKLSRAGVKFYFINDDLAGYRVHSASVQKARDNAYFNRYQLLRDNAYSKIILPYLPVYERFINWYLIFIRKKMIQIGLTKNNKFVHCFYRVLTFVAENQKARLNSNFEDKVK